MAAQQLQTEGASVRQVQADLSTYDGVEALYGAITSASFSPPAPGRPVAAAALNAGVGRGGAFVETDLTDELTVIALNVTSTVAPRQAAAQRHGGAQRGQAAVHLLDRLDHAGLVPGGVQRLKSFVQFFAEAVQNEVKDTEVIITSLMPGPTDTNFFHGADMDDTKIGQGPKDDPAQVAKQGFEALMAGKNETVGGGLKTKAQAAASAVLPDALKAAGHRQMAEPGSGS